VAVLSVEALLLDELLPEDPAVELVVSAAWAAEEALLCGFAAEAANGEADWECAWLKRDCTFMTHVLPFVRSI
jgi:hypothetical protein